MSADTSRVLTVHIQHFGNKSSLHKLLIHDALYAHSITYPSSMSHSLLQ